MAAAIMPSAYARHARAKGMSVAALTTPKVTRNICLVRQRGRTLSPAATLFAQALRDGLK